MYELEDLRPLTKKELEVIRNTLVTTRDFYDNDNLFLKDLPNAGEINCYLYALGFITNSDNYNFNFRACPGFTVDSMVKLNAWKKNLIEAVKQDLEKLQITYTHFSLSCYNSLKEDEYLIKAFMRKPTEYYGEDFHFIRFDPECERWFHKLGVAQPEFFSRFGCDYDFDFDFDDIYNYGNEPVNIKVILDGRELLYEPVGYFAIKELKKENR